MNPTPPASPSDASSVAETSNEPATVSKPNDSLHALILHQLDEDQAADIISIPLAGISTIADYMVIASGRSSRHVAAIAEKISSRIKQEGLGFPRLEGLPTADWVLIDAGDVIVHVFRPEVREFYQLEKMWLPADQQRLSSV